MSAKSATLAKSLHTVSVIVNVARHYAESVQLRTGASVDASGAVAAALCILGYDGAADPYGLAARAVLQLRKDAQ
jgi:hypothetical protein